MAFTYSDTLESARDQVRFLIRDTAEPGLLTDAQVDFLLESESGNIWLAAIPGLTMALLGSRKVSSFSADGIAVSYLSATEIKALADYYAGRAWGPGGGSMMGYPTAGGISRADIEILRRDGDWPRLQMRPELMDNPRIGGAVEPVRDPVLGVTP